MKDLVAENSDDTAEEMEESSKAHLLAGQRACWERLQVDQGKNIPGTKYRSFKQSAWFVGRYNLETEKSIPLEPIKEKTAANTVREAKYLPLKKAKGEKHI